MRYAVHHSASLRRFLGLIDVGCEPVPDAIYLGDCWAHQPWECGGW